MSTGVTVAPHEFKPLRRRDGWHPRGRCRACIVSRAAHPTKGYVTARAIDDRSRAVHLGPGLV